MSNVLPDGYADLGRGNACYPRPFAEDSSGRNTVVPDGLSGICQGGNVPPDRDLYSKSVRGDTPCDGRSWRPIASVCVLLPKIRRLNYASRSGTALWGQCDIFATIRSERRSLRPCPDLVSFLTTTNQKSGGVSARGNRDSDGPFSRSLVRQRFCENAYLGTVDSGSEKFPGRRRARPTARPSYGAVAWAVACTKQLRTKPTAAMPGNVDTMWESRHRG